MVEWRISGLFSHFLGIGHDASRQLIVETNISMAGMFKLVKSKVADASTIDSQASSDLLSVLAELDKITSLRNKIVHWQWGMNEGETATQSNLIKPRNGNQSTQISLTELRDTCLTLMKIFRAIEMNMLILSGQYPRELLIATHRDTSPEKLFRV